MQALADAAAAAMAARDAPASAGALRRTLAARGVAAPMVSMSAGYRTMAEAFSGWRDSPVHDAAMRNPAATRAGVAAASARPGSKHRVYWTLITAGDGGGAR
ncbi:CAP domain-containing protein [Camelimonas abortus]|uniref:CAP domain-containing protein n=1 Tax=Camelimonas abortus TaxID=1017184 RepID=A0ABV7LB98_9HYPH